LTTNVKYNISKHKGKTKNDQIIIKVNEY
jgi:hypothetical protein